MPDAPFRQIKASAGSGKTHALTDAFLRLLAGASGTARSGCRAPTGSRGRAPYGRPEILAATFTNLAAGEMKSRVLDRLKDMALAVRPPDPGWSAARAADALETLLRDFNSLNIRTIDSLLHLLVRLAALDMDLSPEFTPDFNDEAVFNALLDDMLERARENDPPLRADLAKACRQILEHTPHRGFLAGGAVRAKIVELAGVLLKNQDDPDAEPLDDLAPPEAIAARIDDLFASLRAAAGALAQELDNARLGAHANLLKALAACRAADPGEPKLPGGSVFLRKENLDACLNKASRGQASDRAESLYARLRDAADAVEDTVPILRGALRLMPFVDAALRLLDELPAFQRRRGLLPASRVPALAARALDGQYGVNEAFCRMGSRLTHLLVDEFQDTSVEQWLALKPLAVEALARGGTLTVVGDVKQAIYGWRGGEAALFDALPGDPDLLALAPEPSVETLGRNWRSRERIIAWNNAVFAPLGDEEHAEHALKRLLPGLNDDPAGRAVLADAARLVAASFADAAQEAPHKPGGLVRFYDAPDNDDDLPELLADTVHQLHARHPWGEICILTRTNRQTAEAAAALLGRGIPVVTQGSLLLGEQPVIAAILALLAFLNEPDNDVAFWNVLAGQPALFPLPDGLHDWLAGRAASRAPLAVDFAARFPAVWNAVFAPLLDAAALLTPYDAVCELYRRWDIPGRHPRAEGFLLRLLEILHAAETRGVSGLAAFLDYWDAHGKDEKAPLPENMDAVSVMTIHKAKGLQFGVVVVPWHDFDLKIQSPPPVLWEAAGLRVIAPLRASMKPRWQQVLADNAREALHLLYVAWTRPVAELHCFVPDPPPPLLRAVLGEDFDYPFDGLEDGPEAGIAPREAAPDPESGVSGGSDAFGAWPAENGWRPMVWLPRLKIRQSPLDDWRMTAKRRGILAHAALERLTITGQPGHDAAAAVAAALAAFALTGAEREAVQGGLRDALAWYAALPEAREWLARGAPERALTDAEGNLRRVDLLVDEGDRLTAVEYKTGLPERVPLPEHEAQLAAYRALLREATGLPVRGALVYLDRRELFLLEDEA